MLLPGSAPEAALQVAERLRQHTESSEAPGGIRFTLSVGVAHWPDSAGETEAVLQLADQALYSAKREGRNRVMGAPARPRP